MKLLIDKRKTYKEECRRCKRTDDLNEDTMLCTACEEIVMKENKTKTEIEVEP